MSDQADDLPTGGVCNRLEYISAHKMKPFGCKIMEWRRLAKYFCLPYLFFASLIFAGWIILGS
jgi:hypothetical protein